MKTCSVQELDKIRPYKKATNRKATLYATCEKNVLPNVCYLKRIFLVSRLGCTALPISVLCVQPEARAALARRGALAEGSALARRQRGELRLHGLRAGFEALRLARARRAVRDRSSCNTRATFQVRCCTKRRTGDAYWVRSCTKCVEGPCRALYSTKMHHA